MLKGWKLENSASILRSFGGFRHSPAALGRFLGWHRFFARKLLSAWPKYAVTPHVYGITKAGGCSMASEAAVKFSLGSAYAESSQHHSIISWHKWPRTQAEAVFFALWYILPHYFGRAAALFCKVISRSTAAARRCS